MTLTKSISMTEVISRRYSCRTYLDRPIEPEARQQLQDFLDGLQIGPLGSRTRFKLAAATEDDRRALRGLGTYGFIRGATGFIVGAVKQGEKALEDYGYQMEKAVLAATGLNLGTCWLGGSFTKSGFARKISLDQDEFMPAVASVGYIPPAQSWKDARFRQRLQADCRFPWDQLFFDGDLDHPLAPETVGEYAQPLEMLRLSPSASNKQPWRIVRNGDNWHFYLQRTPGYGKGSPLFGVLRLADLQRVDIGIAMCHFELTAQELGLAGKWALRDPGLSSSLEYIASWSA